jgi:hypothetical protein
MLHDDLDRLGLPSDRAAPLHVTIAANRMKRVLDALPEAGKARDAAWALRIVTANFFVRCEYPSLIARDDVVRAFYRGVLSDLPILDAEIERRG